MALSIVDQIALDDALVAPADRLKIGKCNLRLSSDVSSKEATLQVVYDVLKLTPFYKAFQVTADAPEIYRQEFWASAYVHNQSVLSDIEDSHGPSDAMHNPLPATQSQKDFVSKLTEIHSFLSTLSLRNIRVNSFTMKMEILLESTSNKLMVEHAEYDESNTYVLERFNTTAGNLVKKILLKLNLSDHRSHKSTRWQNYKMAKRLCLVDDLKWLKITMSNTSSRNKLYPEINDHYNIFTRESQEYELKTKELKAIKGKGSLEIRDTPLATPTRSYRNKPLSSDKDELKELTVSKPTSSKVSSSKPTSSQSRHLKGAIARMSRRHDYMLQHMRKSLMPRHGMNTFMRKLVVHGIKLEREKTKVELASMVADASTSLRNLPLKLTHAELMFFADKIMTTMLFLRERVVQKGIKHLTKGTDDDESYMENQIVWESRAEELIVQVLDNLAPIYQGCDKNPKTLTRYLYNKDIFYLKYGNLEIRKYVLSLHKIHAIYFPENDVEELKSILVRKVIKKFHLEARYVVHHWKSTWAKIGYIKGQLEKISNLDEVYSDQKIVEVISIQYDQGYVQDFMKEIIVKRADGEMCSFLDLDYKYLNKNDIEDLYMMCLNGKIKYWETGILKSLNVFIRSSVIWTRCSFDRWHACRYIYTRGLLFLTFNIFSLFKHFEMFLTHKLDMSECF
ncbi:hypothetical protein Tco_1408044 [Tanacetum coccineum]